MCIRIDKKFEIRVLLYYIDYIIAVGDSNHRGWAMDIGLLTTHFAFKHINRCTSNTGCNFLQIALC